MNKIVEIKPQKTAGLYSIITDDGFAMTLTAKGIYEYGIKVGKTFNTRDIQAIKEKANGEKAYRYAVYLLGRRDYSSCELLKKLEEKGEDGKKAVKKLIEQGYINDELYAKKIIKKYIVKYGQKRIESELYKKMVPKELWRDLLAEMCADMSDQIYTLLVKKQKGKPFADKNTRDKVYQYFVRQGYAYGDIKKAFNEYEQL